MYLKNSYIVFFVSTLLFSCTEKIIWEEVVVDDDMEYTSAVIQIMMDDPLYTKGINETIFDEYFPGNTANESSARFYNWMMAIFDRYGMLEYYITDSFYPKYIDNTSLTPPDGEKHALHVYKENERLTSGLHHFYVMYNIPTPMYKQLERFEAGTITLQQFEEEILTFPSVNYITNRDEDYSRGFFQLNPEKVSQELVKTTGMQMPMDNYVQIRLSKAAAKVAMAYLPDENDPDAEKNGKLTDVHFKLANIPTRMYGVSRYDTNTFITPHYFDTSYDPSKFQAEPSHDYQPATTKDYPAGSDGKPDQSRMSIAYCMENNNLYALQGNSTCLLIKAQFTPKTWSNPFSPDLLNAVRPWGPPPQTGETYYRVRETATGKYLDDYYHGAYPPDISGISSEYHLEKYEKGYCYYSFFLHDGEGYRVKRNSYYRVLITGVQDAGAPDEDKVIEPEKPVANSSLKMEVIGWETQDQKETLDDENNFN